jgi:hypothetical protein
MRPLLPALLMLMAVLAGCSDSGKPDDAADDSPDGPGGDDGAGTGDEAGPQANATPEPQAFPIDWDGHMGRGACTPTGPNACQGQPAVSTPDDSDLFLEAPGSVSWDVDAEFTWDAADPLMSTLSIQVLAFESCGDGCSIGYTVAEEEGESPLRITATVSLEGNQTGVWIQVSVPRQTPDPVYAYAQVDTDFHAEGNATARFA